MRYTVIMENQKPRIVCTSILVETSPQALPLGAACIASALKHDEHIKDKFSVELIAFSNEDKTLSAQTAASSIINSAGVAPSFVCFSIYVWNRAMSEQIALCIKQQLPRTIIIAGGPEVTANPFSFTNFDYTVAGQGECAVPQLIASLAALPLDAFATVPAVPQGVYTRRDAESFKTVPVALQKQQLSSVTRAVTPLPEQLPSPYLDGTLDPAKYEGALWELARGCPFKCSYCYESKGENKIAYFPKERLAQELELFATKKIPQVFVLDPTYNADRKRALETLDEISRKAPGMFFYFEARAEFIDRELAKAFTRIPCSLQIGLQSADEKVLANVHRTMNKKQFVKNIALLNETGVNFGFDLIYGLPGDTLNGFKQSIDFAISLYPNNIELFCLSVLPGTDLYERSESLGLAYQDTPPYHVQQTPTFPAQDIARAATLAQSCNLFYTKGRAVPWFNTVIKPLHIKPSIFFADFETWLSSQHSTPAERTTCDEKEIEKFQMEFITKKYKEKHLDRQLAAAVDIITLNNALSRTTADGTTQNVRLHYHPDDLFSEYATDIAFFAANAKPCPCIAQTYEGKNGADWKVVK